MTVQLVFSFVVSLISQVELTKTKTLACVISLTKIVEKVFYLPILKLLAHVTLLYALKVGRTLTLRIQTKTNTSRFD